MRLNPVLASALYSAVLLGQAYANEVEDVEESSTTSAESATSSVIEKPTFTVSPLGMVANVMTNTPFSHLISKHRSLSNSQMIGTHGGLHPMQRRKIPKPTRSGHTLVLGPLRNPQYLRVSKVTRVSSWRTRQLTTPYLPSLIRKSIIKGKL